jgi:hypothetical protein
MSIPVMNTGMYLIWMESNPMGGITPPVLSFASISGYDYFQGPNGSNTIGYNAFGVSSSSGANRIYNMPTKTSGYSFIDYWSITYFYNNSSFKVQEEINNTLTGYDIASTIRLYDSNLTYFYLDQNDTTPATATNYQTISQTDDPIIFRGYWSIDLSCPFPPGFPGASVDISINGNAKVTGGTINPGVSPTTFNSNTYGTEDVAYYGGLGGTGLYILINIY